MCQFPIFSQMSILTLIQKWTTHLGQFSQMFPDVWFIPRFRTISGSKNCSVPDVLFKKIIVPDVMLEKRKCPRCVVQRFWMMQMSQMSCSEHFQKTHCPRCVVPKKTLSQMSAPKTLLSQMSCSEHFQKNHCPRCVVPKNPRSQMSAPKTVLSQMSCSEHFQKGNYPRCLVPWPWVWLLIYKDLKVWACPLPSVVRACVGRIRARKRVTRRIWTASELYEFQLRQ